MNENNNDSFFREAPMSRPKRKRGNGKKAIIIVVYIIVVAILAVSAFFISNAILSGTKPPVNNDIGNDNGANNTDDATDVTTAPPAPAYKTVTVGASEVNKGMLILVNSDFNYVEPALGLSLVNVFDGRPSSKPYLTSTRLHQVHPDVLEKFNALMLDFSAATGNSRVQVVGSYIASAEASSEHLVGIALDLNIYGEDGKTYQLTDFAEDYAYLKEILHKYGFILRYPADKAAITRTPCNKPGHIRYVGVPHAYVMASNNLCLEEYAAKIRDNYTLDGEHLIVEDDTGAKYEIYYVASAGETTDIQIPEGCPYTIQGNNVDGFVVTVTIS